MGEGRVEINGHNFHLAVARLFEFVPLPRSAGTLWVWASPTHHALPHSVRWITAFCHRRDELFCGALVSLPREHEQSFAVRARGVLGAKWLHRVHDGFVRGFVPHIPARTGGGEPSGTLFKRVLVPFLGSTISDSTGGLRCRGKAAFSGGSLGVYARVLVFNSAIRCCSFFFGAIDMARTMSSLWKAIGDLASSLSH